jgi:hypothetical protein
MIDAIAGKDPSLLWSVVLCQLLGNKIVAVPSYNQNSSMDCIFFIPVAIVVTSIHASARAVARRVIVVRSTR